MLCRLCHGGLHDLFPTEKDLAEGVSHARVAPGPRGGATAYRLGQKTEMNREMPVGIEPTFAALQAAAQPSGSSIISNAEFGMRNAEFNKACCVFS
jgi:hypothetical protein